MRDTTEKRKSDGQNLVTQNTHTERKGGEKKKKEHTT